MPQTIQGLALIVLFVLPGFVLGAVYNRNLRKPEPTDFRFVVTAIGFSILDYLAISPWAIRIYRLWTDEGALGTLTGHTLEFVLFIFVSVFAFPFLLGYVFSRIIEGARFQPLLRRLGYSVEQRTLTCWDLMAQSPSGAWVIIGFKDGTHIAGKFGTRSYIAQTSLTAQAPRDIFLEEVWESPDGIRISRKVPYSRGGWIDGSEIRWIKLIRAN